MSKRIPLPGMYTAEQAAERIAVVLKNPQVKWPYYKKIISLAKEGKLDYKLDGKNERYWNFDKYSIEEFAKHEDNDKNMQITFEEAFIQLDIEAENAERGDIKLSEIKKLFELHKRLNISSETTIKALKEIIK